MGVERRPKAPDAEERTALARDRRIRALEEPLDVRPVEGRGASASFEVRNARRQTRYFVFLPAFPDPEGALCNCSDFGRRDVGTCKHIESVRIWQIDHPGEGAARPAEFHGRSTWRRIDAAIERTVRGNPRTDPQRARAAGAVLLEPDGRPANGTGGSVRRSGGGRSD